MTYTTSIEYHPDRPIVHFGNVGAVKYYELPEPEKKPKKKKSKKGKK